MAVGVPVVAYIDPGRLEVVPAAMRRDIPILEATPDGLEDVLARLLSDRARLREAGERARAYVRQWHHPMAIAKRMLRLYDSPVLKFWDGFEAERAP